MAEPLSAAGPLLSVEEVHKRFALPHGLMRRLAGNRLLQHHGQVPRADAPSASADAQPLPAARHSEHR